MSHPIPDDLKGLKNRLDSAREAKFLTANITLSEGEGLIERITALEAELREAKQECERLRNKENK